MRAAIVLTLFALAGCAAPMENEEESGSSEAAIVGGSETSTLHPSVGYLAIPGGSRHCTGTLIAPDVVLSAAHCWQGPSKLAFGVGKYSPTKKTYVPRESGDMIYPYAFVHPQFGEPVDGANDLAYVVLEEPVPASVAKPATIGAHSGRDRCDFELIGYGRSVAGSNEAKEGFFDLRKTADFCLTGTEAKTNLLTAKGVDGTSCVGDSGGGLMIEGSGDTLVAVVRGGDSCTLGSVARFTPLASQKVFVARALAASRVK